MRASDRARERTVTRLRAGYAHGELSTETLSLRVETALGARSRNELGALVSDLPSVATWLSECIARWRDRFAEAPAQAATRAVSLPADTSHQVLIGRSPACDIVLEDPSVSRRHAVLYWWRGQWLIKDLASTNGMSNRAGEVREIAVRAGDRLRLGDQEILWR